MEVEKEPVQMGWGDVLWFEPRAKCYLLEVPDAIYARNKHEKYKRKEKSGLIELQIVE